LIKEAMEKEFGLDQNTLNTIRKILDVNKNDEIGEC